MYLPNQIIYDLDAKAPVSIGGNVWDVKAYPKRNTHFIIATGQGDKEGEKHSVFLPRSVAHAQCLLDAGIISPAPKAIQTHCWRCGNWHRNCKEFGCKGPLTRKERA